MVVMLLFKSYWGMEFNPFDKNLDTKNCYSSNDYEQALSRLKHLEKIKGFGLFTGLSGTGKTYTLRCFSNSLNPNLYKTVYIPLSTITVLEFYKALAYGLGSEIYSKKVDLFRSIQERIITLSKDKKIVPVIIIDESQYLKTEVLNDLKILLNFDMDSKNYAIIILSGQPVLNITLSKQIHEALKQRIVVNYNFSGISKQEVNDYTISRLKLCGVHSSIFNSNAIEAIYGCCNGSIRKLNNILEKCLIIGFQNSTNVIDIEAVMSAQNEIELY